MGASWQRSDLVRDGLQLERSESLCREDYRGETAEGKAW